MNNGMSSGRLSEKTLLRLMLCIAFLAILSIALLALHASRHAALDGALAQNRMLAKVLAVSVEKDLKAASEISALVAGALLTNEAVRVADVYAWQSSLGGTLVEVTAYDNFGQCVWSLGKDCEKRGQSAHERADELQAFRADPSVEVYVSRGIKSSSLERHAFHFSRAVRSPSGDLKALVRVSVDPLALSHNLNLMLRDNNSRVELIGLDGHSRIRVDGDASREVHRDLTSYENNATVAQAPGGARALAKSQEGDGAVVGWQKIESYPLYISVSSTPTDALYESRKLLALLCFGMGLLAVILWVLYRTLIKRLDLGNLQRLHFQEKLATLGQVSELKSDIVSVVAHELRSPLSSIMGFAELIAVTTKEEETRDYADTALQGATKLSEIVNNMLDLARLNEGGFEENVEDVELSKVLSGYQKLFSQSAKRKDIELRVEVGEGLHLRCNSGALGRVVSNLLQNAIKFTRRGSITLRGRKGEGGVIIQIEDTGIGMPAADISGIFDRFSKVDALRQPEGKGAGLGLSLVKEAIDSMGGNISVQSRIDEGTCFSLWLPEKPPGSADV